MSTLPFLHVTINLCPPSVMVSTHTSASNAVAFQSSAVPTARTSTCTQSFHYFSFLPRPLRTAPSRFQNTILFGSCTALIRMSDPAAQKRPRAQHWLNALTPGFLKVTTVRSHPMLWFLTPRPDDAKQDLVVYGTEFGVVFVATGLRSTSVQDGLDCLRLYHSGLEGDAHPACEGRRGNFNGHVRGALVCSFARSLRLAPSSTMYAVESWIWSLSYSPTRLTRRIGKPVQ